MYTVLWGNTFPSIASQPSYQVDFQKIVYSNKYRMPVTSIFKDRITEYNMIHAFFGFLFYKDNGPQTYNNNWNNYRKMDSKDKKRAILEGYLDLLEKGYLQPLSSGGAIP
jgi:hypothetical protein